MLLNYFKDDIHTDDALDMLLNISFESYYVKMAVAWAIAEFFAAQREKTLELISSQALDAWTQNKAIQKIRESLKVSKEDKDMLLKYKISQKNKCPAKAH